MVLTLVHRIWKLSIRLQPSERLPLMVRTHAHQLWKLRVEVQPSRRSSSWSGRTKACYGNYLQWTCVRPDDRAIPYRRCSYTGKISPRKFWKILSHSCPSGRSWSTVRTAPRLILLDAHFDPQPINRGPGHLELREVRNSSKAIQQNSVVNSLLLRDVIFPLKPLLSVLLLC